MRRRNDTIGLLPAHVRVDIARGVEAIRRIVIADAAAARYARRTASASSWSEQYDVAMGWMVDRGEVSP